MSKRHDDPLWGKMARVERVLKACEPAIRYAFRRYGLRYQVRGGYWLYFWEDVHRLHKVIKNGRVYLYLLPEGYVTVVKAASELSCARKDVYNLYYAGVLQGIRVAKRLFLNKDGVGALKVTRQWRKRGPILTGDECSVGEAAVIIGVNPKTLRKYWRAAVISGTKRTKCVVVFDRASVLACKTRRDALIRQFGVRRGVRQLLAEAKSRSRE